MLFLGQLILFRPIFFFFFVLPMFNRVQQKFCFLVKRMCQIFFDSFETKNFFPYYPFFSKILEPPFHLRALGNCLIGLVEGPALVAHNLAKHVRYVSSYFVWMEDVPPHLYSILLTDAS